MRIFMQNLWKKKKKKRKEKRKGLELSDEPSVPLANTVPLGGHADMESLWKKRRGLEFSAEPSIPLVSTVPPGGHAYIYAKLVKKEEGLRAQRWTLYSTSQHSTTWWSDNNGKLVRKGGRAKSWALKPLFRQSTQYHLAVMHIREACEERGRALRSERNPLWDDRVLSMGYNDKKKNVHVVLPDIS